MAQAALLLLFGLGALWTLLVERVLTPQDWFFAALAIFACMALSARFLSRTRGTFTPTFKAVIVFFARASRSWRDAAAVMSAALSADVKLRPSLVRVRLRGTNEAAHAAFANLVTAAPGAASVELDADGLLVHVLQEDSIDARALGRLEASLNGPVDQAEARA